MISLKDETILILMAAEGRALRLTDIMRKIRGTKEASRVHQILEELKKSGIAQWDEGVGGYAMRGVRRDDSKRAVNELDIKLSVLERLEKLMAPDIGSVLKKIHADLMRAYTNA